MKWLVELLLALIVGTDTVAQTPATKIELWATGDVMLGRAVNAYMVQTKNFKYPFEKVAEKLSQADVVLINLEAPFLTGCRVTTEGMSFCADMRSLEGLEEAGVDVVNIANNHIYNQGKTGEEETKALLLQSGMTVTGNGMVGKRVVKNKTFGFLSYNTVGNSIQLSDMQADIEKLKKEVDYVVVSFHWGVEYVTTPNKYQRELAHQAIEAGADLVIGNHPHWVQDTEWYKDKFIAYSHGNLVFDQSWSKKTQQGVVGKYIFRDNQKVEVEFLPVEMDKYGQVRFVNEN